MIAVIALAGYMYFAGQGAEDPRIAGSETTIVKGHSPSELELLLAAEKLKIEKMFADGDVVGLIAMLSYGQDPSKILAAQALGRIGDASALAKLEELNKLMPAGDTDNPFKLAIAAITERVEIEEETPDPPPSDEEVAVAPGDGAVPMVEEYDPGDVDNTEEGVFGLKVVDKATGKGIAASQVKFQIGRQGDRSITDVVTDKWGRIDFEYGEKPNWVKVFIEKTGYVPMHLYFRTEARGQDIPLNYLLQLEKGTTIAGIVKTKDGQTVKGVNVNVSIHGDYEKVENYTVNKIKCPSGADGKWQCDVIPERVFEVYLAVEHDEYVSTEKYSVHPPMESLRAGTAVVYVRKGITLNGFVGNAEGNPIADATIFKGDSRHSNDKERTKTDAAGKFTFNKLKTGSLILTAKAAGFAQDMKTVEITDAPEEVTFYLTAGKTIKVYVTDVDGNPIKGVRIEGDEWRPYRYNDRSRNIRLSARTNEDGLAVLKDVPTDEVLYSMYHRQFASLDKFPLSPDQAEHHIELVKRGRITGRVYDAETDETIKVFSQTEGIEWRGQGDVSWQSHRVKKVTTGIYAHSFNYNNRGIAVKIEAEGYLPSETPIYFNEGIDTVYDVAMYKTDEEQVEEGIVYLPDGRPAANMEITVVRKGQYLRVKYGIFSRESGVTVLKADSSGRFKLPQIAGDYRLVAMNDDGVADITKELFNQTATLYMQKWGRVEGTVWIGMKPAAGSEVNLNCDFKGNYDGPRVNYEHRVTADDKGKFVFRMVRPGEVQVSRIIKISERSSSYASQKVIDVLPGETTKVDIGGGGRKVIGRFVISGYTFDQIDMQYSHFNIRGKVDKIDMSMMEKIEMPKITFPDNFFSMTKEEKMAWSQELMKSQEFQEYQKKVQELSHNNQDVNKSYRVVTKSDGSFVAQDVLPGEYTLSGNAMKKSTGNKYSQENVVAMINFDFTVDDFQEGKEDEPVDIGVVGATKETGASTLKVGYPAPAFSVKDVNNKTISLSSYAGKFVVLNIGGAMANMEYNKTHLPYLKQAHDTFAGDGNMEIISVYMGWMNTKGENPIIRPLKIFIDKENIGWKIGLALMESPTEQPKIIRDYAMAMNALVLVGPDGRVIDKKVKPEELMDKLSAAMGNLTVPK
jgi:hypothetical protein